MIRYRLYIDESGDHISCSVDDPARRYLCLLGLFVETGVYRTLFHPGLERLKQTHFPHSPDDPVILTRRKLLYRRGPFGRLHERDNEERFNCDLLEFLAHQDYRIIGVTIDKKAHMERYGKAAFRPYHACFAALLERYCEFLNHSDAQGKVLAESRGRTEDSQLKQSYRSLYQQGTNLRSRDFFCRALTIAELKLKNKSANVAGLQVADLLAHPVKQEILIDEGRISDPGDVFARQLWAAIASKYNRDPVYAQTIWDYGKIFLG